mmetsp:Transcript_7133/g.21760  ORF Transcript_7133/g.21760 Transcript_7133/m.21760 type:complete len:525 (+) Transcript_7133:128-1702(+)
MDARHTCFIAGTLLAHRKDHGRSPWQLMRERRSSTCRRSVVHCTAGDSSEDVPRPSMPAERASVWTSIRRVFSVQDIDKQAARLAIPAVGALALEPLIALIDTYFLGQLGTSEIASAAIAKGAFGLFLQPFNFLGIATLPLVATAFSREDMKEASKIIAHTLLIALSVGTAISALLYFIAPAVVTKLGASSALLPNAVMYLRHRLLGGPFLLAAFVCAASYRAFQDTVTPLYIAIVSDLVNVLLYPTLIFHAGLGLRGAAVASTVCQILSSSLSIAVLVKRRWIMTHHLTTLPSYQRLVALLRDGAALLSRTLSIMTVLSMANIAAARRGTVSLAAFEIQRQMWSLAGRILDAIAVAAQSLVPLALGRADFAAARQIAVRLLQMALLAGILLSGGLLVSSGSLTSIFTSSNEVRQGIMQCLPVIAVFLPINGVLYVLEGVYSSARRFGTLSGTIVVAGIVSSAMLLYLQRTVSLGIGYVVLALNIMLVMRLVILSVIFRSKWTPIPDSRSSSAPSSSSQPREDS